MKKSHLASFCISITLFSSTVVFGSGLPETVDEALTTNRLVALCKLWAKVKYFHPRLANRSDIDWDEALIKTIPRVQAAKSSQEFATAIEKMLLVLGDSSTRLNDGSRNKDDDSNGEVRTFGYRMTEDQVLVITAGSYFELWNPENQSKLKVLSEEVLKAKSIVFDLRSEEAAGDYGRLQLTSSFDSIESLITTKPMLTLGLRSRLHHGYKSNSVFSSGQYRSGYYLQDVKRVTPAKNAKDIPSVHILNENSALLNSTIPSQTSGNGLIVFDGDKNEVPYEKTESIDLGEGLSAEFRLFDPILEDGTSGDLQPDMVVPKERDSDAAMKAALNLARNFAASKAVRAKVSIVASPIPDKPFRDNDYPSVELRLLAAFRIWAVVTHFYPYKHLIEEDWDTVLREFIPKFMAAGNELEYSLTVAEMVTHIHDTHAYVSGNVINKHFGTGYPPIRVRLIEDRLVVTRFFDDEMAKTSGLKIGDIVLKVDNEDAKERFERYAKYISASTPQSRTDKASLMFMNGPDDSEVELTILDRKNLTKKVRLRRKFEDFNTLYHRERSGEIVKLLEGNIGYVDLDRLPMEKIDEMLDQLKNTKAIVFDMRGYPNNVFWYLPQRLTEKRNAAAAFFQTPVVGAHSPTNSAESFFQMIQPPPPDKWIYKGKTMMLIDERSVSQAEHTGLFLRAANGTKFVGSHTAGANGEVTSFLVPGGIGIGFTGQSVKWPDGRQLQRIGLIPDIEVKPTIAGIRNGRDEVLEKAIQYLQKELVR